ncbi:MAG: NUDIX hydrolase [Candidatus Marinimicrobia bacterium]|nr:NUDIX hydrolase [Candidatus Neomarinimicrobiota bacterium]MBT3496170.1 NUDIX hydrolase [Candidatus Neomarinimicrobiota bacterium]MBT3692808.1 NUDIX hydrolase [Candidatus Neomarinimicrobiota bacterium]MBT3731841.1 NUDIX hydrolase [Candidatus Neomarinimicrobiota bacterium]MBT4145142.1 NUDIX hydrolase [Candidatus Neomarinimicrobiota bacterium]
MSDLKEIRLSSEIIFQGRLLDVRKDIVELPNGKTSTREWINHPGAVCIIPILPDGKLALIRQFRYAVQKEMIELPAGKLDKDENPEDCAVRELEEEIGYRAKTLTFLTNIHPAIGFANEKMWLYLGEDLEKTDKNCDEDEFIELMPTTLKDALQMVWDGEITDVKTVIGILWAEKILSK